MPPPPESVTPPGDAPADVYRERHRRFAAEAARLEARSLLLSRTRLMVALVAMAAGVGVVFAAGGDPRPWLHTALGAGALFLALVVVHERVIRAEQRWRGLAELQEEGLARLGRRWDLLPVPVATAPAEHRGLARDLQLFGRASLLQLLGTAQSPLGRETLVEWLLAGAPPEELAERQQAVAALAEALDLRHELALEGRRLALLEPDVEPFLTWAEGEPWLLGRPALLWGARGLPAAAWGAAALALAGVLPVAAPAALFAANFLLANLLVRRLEEAHDRISAREREMGTYARTLATLERPAAAALELRLLERLQQELTTSGTAAWQHLERLQRRLDFAEARRSGLLRLALGTLFLWDVHTLWLLERWQMGPGRHARRWLAALGRLEALAALASLRFEEPGWAFPQIEPAADRLEAKELAHPLLAPERRVANDVTVGPPGSVLLVTGSNMSGKSTLLRALGLNAVLARAGGPVCARELRMPPATLATSILVEDSLEEGISQFMAEVLRIRQVVAAAYGAAHDGGREAERVLYLLDEVLHGTNSADRRVAVREVLQRLIARGAIGAVTTHDLGLAEEESLQGALVPVHFRETLHPEAGPAELPMTFDYRLRPGLAPTSNALELLEMFGLPREGSVPPEVS
jgi:hypothetical protein